MTIPSLATWLARTGLAPEDRLLCAGIATIPSARWDLLAALIAATTSADDVASVESGADPEAPDRVAVDGVEYADWAEMLLQAVLFCGFPRVVTAFERLAAAWPEAHRHPNVTTTPTDQRKARGLALFDAIYADNAPAVHQLLRGFHPEFHDFVLEAAYGRVLTRPHFDARRRELLAVAALDAMDQTRQLVAHARGAMRFGATETEVREVMLTSRHVLDRDAGDAVEQLLARIVRGMPTDSPRVDQVAPPRPS